MRLQQSLKKDTDYNTSIIILPLVCGFWRRLTKSLGMSLDALSQLIAIVREHVNALLRSTMSLTCFSVSFSEPWPWILKLNFPTLRVNEIFDFGFCIFSIYTFLQIPFWNLNQKYYTYTINAYNKKIFIKEQIDLDIYKQE